VDEYLESHGQLEGQSSSALNPGRDAPHSDPEIAGAIRPSAYSQVLRQFSPEVADEYERVQNQRRAAGVPFAIHPRDGFRVTLDYALPPWMEGSLEGQPVEYEIREGLRIQLYESDQSRHNCPYNTRLRAAMRDELLRRNLAQIDVPDGRHPNHRFLACRMCPRCFKGPLSEDEVGVLKRNYMHLLFQGRCSHCHILVCCCINVSFVYSRPSTL
jgi:hypothetical protein